MGMQRCSSALCRYGWQLDPGGRRNDVRARNPITRTSASWANGHYLYFNSPNYGWGNYVTGDDDRRVDDDLSEFECDVYFSYYVDIVSYHRMASHFR